MINSEEALIKFAAEAQALANKHNAEYSLEISERSSEFSCKILVKKYDHRGDKINGNVHLPSLIKPKRKPGRPRKK